MPSKVEIDRLGITTLCWKGIGSGSAVTCLTVSFFRHFTMSLYKFIFNYLCPVLELRVSQRSSLSRGAVGVERAFADGQTFGFLFDLSSFRMNILFHSTYAFQTKFWKKKTKPEWLMRAKKAQESRCWIRTTLSVYSFIRRRSFLIL